MANTTHDNYRDNWELPRWIFDWLDRKFHFVADLFASDENTLVPSYYFTEKNSALIADWHRIPGFTYANPPFGGTLTAVLDKAVDEVFRGWRGVFILPNNSSSSWFHRYVEPYAKVTVIEGRIQFLIDGERPKRLCKKTGEMVPTNNSGANIIATYPKWVDVLPDRVSLASIKTDVFKL